MVIFHSYVSSPEGTGEIDMVSSTGSSRFLPMSRLQGFPGGTRAPFNHGCSGPDSLPQSVAIVG